MTAVSLPPTDRSYVGDATQHVCARPVVFDDGPERGVRAIEVDIYRGMRTTVLVDRGLDLAQTWVGGTPLAWVSPTGPVHPGLVDGDWLRGFHGGLLTTCGVGNVGPDNVDDGQTYGLHGRVSYLPARNVASSIVQDDDGESWLDISGELTETVVYGGDLRLRRRLRFSLTRPTLRVHDEVTNAGFRPEPLLLLYHVNLGHPLVSPTAQLLLPPHTTQPRDDASSHAIADYATFAAPAADATGEVFEHVITKPGVWASAGVANPAGGNLAALVRWRPSQLPRLWHWRMLGEGRYLTGIEPANCGVAGRAVERGRNALDILGPGECRRFDLEIHAAADVADLDRVLALHAADETGESHR